MFDSISIRFRIILKYLARKYRHWKVLHCDNNYILSDRRHTCTCIFIWKNIVVVISITCYLSWIFPFRIYQNNWKTFWASKGTLNNVFCIEISHHPFVINFCIYNIVIKKCWYSLKKLHIRQIYHCMYYYHFRENNEEDKTMIMLLKSALDVARKRAVWVYFEHFFIRIYTMHKWVYEFVLSSRH